MVLTCSALLVREPTVEQKVMAQMTKMKFLFTLSLLVQTFK